MSYQVHIYTDGAAKGNPGPGGYGVVMEMVGTPYKKEFFEGFTNIGITAGLLIVGTAITVSGIIDRKNRNEKANENVNINIKSAKVNNDAEDIEDIDNTKEETWEK